MNPSRRASDPDFLAGRFLDADCHKLTEENSARKLELCDVDWAHTLTSSRKILWALRDEDGIHAVRAAVGRGSVTVLNASPFRYRDFLLGDHPRLFVAATQLRRGDTLQFLTEEDQASIVSLTWRFGAPAVLLLLAAVALALWRAGPRFGPRIAATETARRSLAEQIRGTGQFALRFGGGEALHAATLRALRDAAIRRVPSYDAMSGTDASPRREGERHRRGRSRAGHELPGPTQFTRAARGDRGARNRQTSSVVDKEKTWKLNQPPSRSRRTARQAAHGHWRGHRGPVPGGRRSGARAGGFGALCSSKVSGTGQDPAGARAVAGTAAVHGRVQFTPDMMPSDITGHAVLDPKTMEMRIVRGPVFTHLLLADEINRAPAKTQSALLEVMQEYQVTLEGQTHVLPKPFMVLATQNPVETEGTYPLPEAQLDRFLFKIEIGYPSLTTKWAS
jgi:hypothetical protein